MQQPWLGFEKRERTIYDIKKRFKEHADVKNIIRDAEILQTMVSNFLIYLTN